MLLSVIVPVYDVEAFLPACLDSVLGQDFTDLELIAIDDGSPDACGSILHRYAVADPRVSVVHLDRNVGLGPARTLGIHRARGDYLMFLDSDDTLADGALAAIAERLGAAAGPDVLIVDHARTYADGREQRNLHSRTLVALADAVFVAHDHPEIFQLLQVAWNKVYRRGFVTEQGLEFPPGFYEDTAWTHIALMSARSIAVLPMVCVHYRQRATGSILSSRSRRHFDAITQWQLLLDHLDAHPELSSWRPLVLQRAIDHYATILLTPHRLSGADRSEFHRAAQAHLRANLRGLSLPSQGRRADLKRWVLLHAGLPALQAAAWLDHRVTGARRGARRGTRRVARLGPAGSSPRPSPSDRI